MKIEYFDDGSMFLNQMHYVKNLLVEYGLEDFKTSGKPAQSDIKLIKSTEEETKKFKEKGLDYFSAIGSSNYLYQCTRPDITYTVGKISKFFEKPGDQHWKAFKRTLKYSKVTSSLGIMYRPNNIMSLWGYVDSSYGENDKSQSTNGDCF